MCSAGPPEDEVAYFEKGVDAKDAAHQLASYKSQGFIKELVSPDQAIDRRYVVPMKGDR